MDRGLTLQQTSHGCWDNVVRAVTVRVRRTEGIGNVLMLSIQLLAA